MTAKPCSACNGRGFKFRINRTTGTLSRPVNEYVKVACADCRDDTSVKAGDAQ